MAHLPPDLLPTAVSYPRESWSYAELLPIVREALPDRERFLLLAESFSGPLAIRAAADQPAGLAGLIFAGSFARCPLPRGLAAVRGLVRSAAVRATPWPLVRALVLGRKPPAALERKMRQAIDGLSPGVLAARIREVLQVDVCGPLASVTVPVLYLAGKRDRLVRPSSAALIRSATREFRRVDLDAPHLVLQIVPDAAARAISDFARDVGASGEHPARETGA